MATYAPRHPSYTTVSHAQWPSLISAFPSDLGNQLSLSSASAKFISLCLLWYMSSALFNNSAKQILTIFKHPVTLTFVQFGFISGWCVLLALFQQLRGKPNAALFGATTGIRRPTRRIILTTAPLSLFQVAGHVFGSLATSQIPVSVVHTVKARIPPWHFLLISQALSPAFTVLTYRFLFHVHYSTSTYLSLLPLTLGVMLACSFDLSANLPGLVCALGSTIVFVSQNIFIKKLHFREPSPTEANSLSNGHPSVTGMFQAPQEKDKLDKLNILFYSSGMAFLLMIPIWLFHEGANIIWQYFFGLPSLFVGDNPAPLAFLFLFNGTVHFGQNIIAFSLLSVASPVAYSIAGLVKRIFVIVVSIIWFGQPTTLIQALGIIMTFAGLYMYDRAKMEVARGERKVERFEYREKHLLPLDTSDLKAPALATSPTALSASSATEVADAVHPRRRSSSLSRETRPGAGAAFPQGRGLRSIQEVTHSAVKPPPVAAKVLRLENKAKAPNGHRRRYSQVPVNGLVEMSHWNQEAKSPQECEAVGG